MTVYVDEPLLRLGRMHMCHMAADTTAELLDMADTIGVDRGHIQKSGTYMEHFDICKSKRNLAIEAGAIEISQRELGAHIIKRRRKGANES